MRRIIREEEPPRPSTRLSTLGETLTSVSAQRQTDPKKLSQTIRGELDWIVMKSLEKDRARRYETANGLARDVERYLSDDRVEAYPPSRAYRMKKFVRRHRVAMFAGSAIAASLLVGFIGTAIGLVQAHRQERLTRIAYGVAERNLAMVSNADGRGDSDNARHMAREALAIHRQLLSEGDFDVCQSLHVLSMTLTKSNPDEAIALERESIANQRKLTDSNTHWLLPYSLDTLANLLMRRVKRRRRTPLFLEALPLWRKTMGNNHVYVANTLEPLAVFAAKEGRPQDAERYLRECLEIRRRMQASSPRSAAKTLDMLVDLLKQQGRSSEAEAIRRQAAPTTIPVASSRPTPSQPR